MTLTPDIQLDVWIRLNVNYSAEPYSFTELHTFWIFVICYQLIDKIGFIIIYDVCIYKINNLIGVFL